jgi:heat-inducible transcriptional repressor
LEDVTVIADLERIRALLETLETRESLTGLLQAAEDAEGVQIFIGSENSLFSLSGCSMIVKPFDNDKQQIIGAIGVVGPTRINYARIIPMVDYTAQLVGRLLA